MFTALISFLGGTLGRFAIGQLTDWLQKRQAHLQEIERIREQEKVDQAVHLRQMASIKLQSDLKVSEIKLIGENAIGLAEANAFTEAMKVANAPTGVKWIDGWNGSIRPLVATNAVLLWLLAVCKNALIITDWDKNLIASVLGYYFADRHIGKSSK